MDNLMNKSYLDDMISSYDFTNSSIDDTFDFLMFMARRYEILMDKDEKDEAYN